MYCEVKKEMRSRIRRLLELVLVDKLADVARRLQNNMER
jgi:hypothetical protein